MHAQLLSEKLYNKVTADVKVTDAEVTKYYNDHTSQYTTPESRDVRHILVTSKKKADELYAQLRRTAPTSRRSRRSTRPTRSRQGRAAS